MKLEFNVELDEETETFVASWDDPAGGGITTQVTSLSDLRNSIAEAVRCHFLDRKAPAKATIHFVKDLELQLA